MMSYEKGNLEQGEIVFEGNEILGFPLRKVQAALERWGYIFHSLGDP